MFLIKKFFLLGGIVSSGIIGVSAYSYVNNQKIQNKIDALNEKFKHWTTPSSSSGQQQNTNLSSLFSENLNSFTSFLSSSISEQAIYKWAQNQVNNPDNPFAWKIKSALSSYTQNKYQWVDKGSVDTSSYQRWVIANAYTQLKEIFLDYLFNVLYLKLDNSKSSLSVSDNNNDIATLQKTLVDEWLKQERPFLITEKTFEYSTTAPTIFKNLSQLNLQHSSYDFPDFNVTDDYKNFIDSLKNKTFKEDIGTQKLYTVSDLGNLNDSYKLSYLINEFQHLSTNSKKSTGSSGSTTTVDDKNKLTIDENNAEKLKKNPLYLFIDKCNTSSCDCVKINPNLLETSFTQEITSSSTQNNSSEYCLAGYKKIKIENSNSGATGVVQASASATSTEKYITVSRDQSGISVFYESNKTGFIEKVFSDLNTTSNSEIKTKFLSFVRDNFDYLIAKFHAPTSSNNISDFEKMIDKTVYYLGTLYENQGYSKIWDKLSHVASYFERASTETVSSTNYLKTQHGLLTPLFFEKNIDKTTEVSEITFSSSSSATQTTTTNSNDGTFKDLLSKYYTASINFTALQSKASELKSSIKTFTSSLNQQQESKNLHSFNDFIMDSVFFKFMKNDALIHKHQKNSWILSQLSIDLTTGSIDDYLTKVVNIIKTKFSETNFENNKLKSIIQEIYFLNQYLSMPFEEKYKFGGYKEDTNNINNLLVKSKNVWTIKNYFSTGNLFELTSEESEKYLNFLYWLIFLFENQGENLHAIIKHLIPEKESSYLVWMDSIKDSQDTNNKVDTDNTNSVNSLKNITNFFKQPSSQQIFAPFLEFKTFKSISSAHTYSESSNSLLSANAYKDNSNQKNLYGFTGLHSSTFSSSTIPEYIKSMIFKSWSKINPSQNKNYCDSPSTTTSSSTDSYSNNLFGITDSKNQTITAENATKFFDSFSNKKAILEYIQKNSQAFYSKLLSQISTDGKNVSSITFSELKEEIKQTLTQHSASLNDFKRFCGNIQNPSQQQMINNGTRYLINEDPKSNSGYLVFVQQINQYDLLNNLAGLKESVDVETLIKTLLLIAQNPESIKKMEKMKNSQFFSN